MSKKFPSGSSTVLTASGCIANSTGGEVFVFGLASADGSALATLIDSKAGTSGSNRWTLRTAASASVVVPFEHGITCGSGIYVYLSGTSACAFVGWRK